MTSTIDLEAEFRAFEHEARAHLGAAAASKREAPQIKAHADKVAALQAVGAALRTAELHGPLGEVELSRAVLVIRAVRGAYTFLGDSSAAAMALMEAEEHSLHRATAAREARAANA